MDGSSRLFGIPSELEINGVKYEVRPRILSDYGTVERRILATRRSAVEVAAAKVALFEALPELQKYLLKAALEIDSNGYASADEVAGWLNTLPGVAYSTWASIKHNDDAPSEEAIRELVADEYSERMVTILGLGIAAGEASEQALQELLLKYVAPAMEAAGGDDRGNSTGSGPSPPKRPESETDQSKTPNESESPGDTFTNPSVGSTDT